MIFDNQAELQDRKLHTFARHSILARGNIHTGPVRQTCQTHEPLIYVQTGGQDRC